ncbi:MAG: hypothetical protein Q7S33_01335 [Nanoarchaeota archaeon]|nr:hypothetical protein [Nanoarchaeota archaeon]
MEKQRYLAQSYFNERVLEISKTGNAILEINKGQSKLFGFVEKDIAYEYVFNSRPREIGKVKYR